MVNQYTNPWSTEELKTLQEYYPHLTYREVSKLLPLRSRSAINKHAMMLSLRKDPSVLHAQAVISRKCVTRKIGHDLWVEAEVDTVRKHYAHTTHEEMKALLPSRKLTAISRMAHKLGIHKGQEARSQIARIVLNFPLQGDIWTQQEDDILRQCYINSPKEEIARRFPNMKWTRILRRASTLGVNRDKELLAAERVKARCVRPTVGEHKFMSLCEEHNLPIRYVGDGQVIIGGRCPDFIHRTEDKVIEIFGSYWHSDANSRVKPCYHYQPTMEHYKRCGFDCLILWDYELNDEKLVLTKVAPFLEK